MSKKKAPAGVPGAIKKYSCAVDDNALNSRFSQSELIAIPRAREIMAANGLVVDEFNSSGARR